jgi:RNA polymerase sigma-70 factor (ECF subfamily)
MDLALNLSHVENSRESKLIQACLNEERWAQRQLYETYYGKMLGVCMRYANHSEDARDILNEGFIKVFRYLSRYQIGTSLECWIRRIMINTSIDFYRKSIRHRTEEIDAVREVATEDEDAISQYTTQEIMAAIQQLPPSYRAVFNLYAIEGYSHKEIAEALDISESTSRSNLVKARMKLKTTLIALYPHKFKSLSHDE